MSNLPAVRSRVEPQGSRILQQFKADRERQRQLQRVGRGHRPVYVALARGYDAAKHDNLTFGWTSHSASANEDVRAALDTVRARSRDLAANNDYMRRFLRMCEINIVGPNGFTYKNLASANSGAADEAARDLIALHWAQWGKRGVCEVTGRYSFTGLLKQVVRATARDGEYLLRIVRGRAARNAYSFALQLLDIDRLDTRFNGEHNGNRLIMGVEVDASGRPVAYHLHTKHPKDWSYIDHSGRTIERVLASDILHGGIADRPEQYRFMPWAHTAMLRLEMLGKFQTAAIAAARKGAETFGVLQRSADADPTLHPLGGEGGEGEGEEGADGEIYQTSLPGQWDTLPPGYTMQAFESAYPNALFGEFVKDALRGVSAGFSVSYHGLGNDLEGVNFSSIRAGVLDERDSWMDFQGFFIEDVLDRVHDEWLGISLLAGAITYPTGSALPAVKRDSFTAHKFTGRRWQWVDPKKDADANRQAVQDGHKSHADVAAEQGRDFYDVVDAIATEQEYARSKGVQLGTMAPASATAAAPSPAPAPAASKEEEEEDDAESKQK